MIFSWIRHFFVLITDKYARARVGATSQEARAYNTTDRILLTFDDFGDAATVTKLLAILEVEHVKAVFFLIGKDADAHPEIVTQIRQAGHWIGNHTYSHLNLASLSEATLRTEITKGPKGALLRPPFGIYNKKVRKIAAELGYKIAYWTIDSKDWQESSPKKMLARILPDLHAGACILLHINGVYTLEVLPQLIHEIRAQGFELCHQGTEIKI